MRSSKMADEISRNFAVLWVTISRGPILISMEQIISQKQNYTIRTVYICIGYTTLYFTFSIWSNKTPRPQPKLDDDPVVFVQLSARSYSLTGDDSTLALEVILYPTNVQWRFKTRGGIWSPANCPASKYKRSKRWFTFWSYLTQSSVYGWFRYDTQCPSLNLFQFVFIKNTLIHFVRVRIYIGK